MSARIDVDMDVWGSLDWDEELERANSQQSQELAATNPSGVDVDMDREGDADIEDQDQATRGLSSTFNPSNIDPELERCPRERCPEQNFHPGWASVMSPPLETSNHSTPPEVMRWARSPYILGSMDHTYMERPDDRRRNVLLLNARVLVHSDVEVDLSAYKFPLGASGIWNPLPPPFPRDWWKPRKTRLREAETLEYTASDIRAIQRNVRLQLQGPKTSAEIHDESQSERDWQSYPSSKSDSGYDGDISSTESTGEDCLRDSGVGFAMDCE
ncbi:hypothetical protein HDK77DRAFT_430083 [Phyllosticta capitalensis]